MKGPGSSVQRSIERHCDMTTSSRSEILNRAQRDDKFGGSLNLTSMPKSAPSIGSSAGGGIRKI